MKQTYTNFEDFLKEQHSENYTGIKDDMEDDLDRWMSNLDIQELIDFADEYANKYAIQKVEERINSEK